MFLAPCPKGCSVGNLEGFEVVGKEPGERLRVFAVSAVCEGGNQPRLCGIIADFEGEPTLPTFLMGVQQQIYPEILRSWINPEEQVGLFLKRQLLCSSNESRFQFSRSS